MTTLRYDPSSGDDFAASGAGPIPAVTLGDEDTGIIGGTGTEITLVSLEGRTPDLSEVQAGDVLWVSSSTSGRRLSVITDVDSANGIVTVEDDLGTVSGAMYAIGGVRRSLYQGLSDWSDLEDAKPGWTFSLEPGTFQFSREILIGGGSASEGPVTIEGADPNNPPLMEGSHNGPIFDVSNGFITFKSLKGTTANATNSATMFARGSTGAGQGRLKFIDCELYGMLNAWEAFFSDGTVIFSRCEIYGMGSHGINQRFPTGGTVYVDCCNIHDCGGYGVSTTNTNATLCQISIHGSTIWGNGAGILIDSTDGSVNVSQSVISGNSNNGIMIYLAPSDRFVLNLKNTAITLNGGYGISNSTLIDATYLAGINSNNAFGLNTSGRTQASGGWPVGDNEQTVTADPYEDSDNGDFTPNDDPNGGELLVDNGCQGLPIGAIARPLESGGGSGGGPVVGCRFIQPLGV